MIPTSLVVNKIKRYPVTSGPDLAVVVLGKTPSQVDGTANIKSAIFPTPQDVDVIHGYFKGLDIIDTVAR